MEKNERALRDVIGTAGEQLEGRPLLRQVMRAGQRLEAGRETLQAARRRAADELRRLPPAVVGLSAADPPYPVELGGALERATERVTARVERNNV